MRLHTNPASPFGRKVMIVVLEKGLEDRVEAASRQVSPVAPNAAVVADNPLGKIPCLVTDDGLALYDSRVIAEYLDGQGAAPVLFPAAGRERLVTLGLQALGDGILDAGVATRYETFLRPEALRWSEWVAGQKLKITRSLDHLEADIASLDGRIDVGSIAIGCALGYLDFRFADDPWREGRPGLAAWYERFAKRPSMQATKPA
jgi:glutathione S-transferase